MNIQLLNKNISDIKTDILVEFLTSDNLTEHPESKVLNQAGFKAEQDSICFLHEKGILFCGIEKKKSDEIRSAAASVIKALKSSNYESAKISVLSNSTLTGLIEGIVLGGYEFNDYKSEPKEITIKDISLSSNELDFDELQTTFNKALIVANATCFTRDIVNTAPQELNPQTMATLAEKLATDNSLECNILHEEELEKEKMGSMLAVGRASIHGSALIHLAYKPANPKKVISLVGKGLTYDSGGLSLKPAASMVTMKMDKAGACSVLGMIKAASEQRLDVEIHAFIGAVSNMIVG